MKLLLHFRKQQQFSSLYGGPQHINVIEISPSAQVVLVPVGLNTMPPVVPAYRSIPKKHIVEKFETAAGVYEESLLSHFKYNTSFPSFHISGSTSTVIEYTDNTCTLTSQFARAR